MSKDLYKILEIGKDADAAQIKKAYRHMAKIHHPDKNPDDENAEARFKDIAEAYEILGNEETKSIYDRMGYDALKGGSGGFNEHHAFDAMSMMFEQMRREQQNMVRKQKFSIFQIVKLTMNEVYNGVTKTFKYNRIQKCGDCNGKGGENVVRCSVCDGKGVELITQDGHYGTIQSTISCRTCDGRGFKISNTCNSCTGKGFLTKIDELTVDIPHSVLNNEQIHIVGKGHYYNDDSQFGDFGDLILTTQVDESEFTILRDFGLISKVELPYETLVLGGEHEFKTIDGSTLRVGIPKLTELGKKLKLKGRGLKYRNSEVLRGDQYLMVDLKFPTEISSEEEEILNNLKKVKK